MNYWGGFVFTIALLAGNAFFVAAEFALVASRRDKLETLATTGKKGAKLALRATSHLSLMLAASQLGITICSLLLGKVAEPVFAKAIEGLIAPLGLSVSPGFMHLVSFLIALTIISFFHILFGEMVPKNITLSNPEKASAQLMPLHFLFMQIAKPFIHLFNWCSNSILRMFGVQPKEELSTGVSIFQLRSMIDESGSLGLLDNEESIRLDMTLDAIAYKVRDVMIPRESVRSLTLHDGVVTLKDLEVAVQETGYSRYPILEDGGSYLGYIHVKDALPKLLDSHESSDTPIPLSEIRPLPRIPADTPVSRAIETLQKNGEHVAALTETSSATIIGLVALEDIIEKFVGNIRDATHRLSD